MNWGTLAFWIVALGVALVAVLNVAGGIRDLLTGLRKDLIDTQRARLGIEKDRLELDQKLPREIEKLSREVENLRQEAFQASPEETARLQGDFAAQMQEVRSAWPAKEKSRG